jgi:hypothetical protein
MAIKFRPYEAFTGHVVATGDHSGQPRLSERAPNHAGIGDAWQVCNPLRGNELKPVDGKCKCNTTAYPYLTADVNGTCICSPERGYQGQPFFVSNITSTNPTGCLFCKYLAKKPRLIKFCKVWV